MLKVLLTPKVLLRMFFGFLVIVALVIGTRMYIDHTVLAPIRARLDAEGMTLSRYHANLFECPAQTKFGGRFVAVDEEGHIIRGTVCIPKNGGEITVNFTVGNPDATTIPVEVPS